MPINKARCDMPAWASAQVKRPAPKGPEQYSADGTANTGAIVPAPKPHDYDGPSKVITPYS